MFSSCLYSNPTLNKIVLPFFLSVGSVLSTTYEEDLLYQSAASCSRVRVLDKAAIVRRTLCPRPNCAFSVSGRCVKDDLEVDSHDDNTNNPILLLHLYPTSMWGWHGTIVASMQLGRTPPLLTVPSQIVFHTVRPPLLRSSSPSASPSFLRTHLLSSHSRTIASCVLEPSFKYIPLACFLFF